MFKIRLQHENSVWYGGAALTCFVMAVAAAAFGNLLTTASLVNTEQHPTLHAIGLIMLVLCVPILILGGHCLDLNDRKRKRLK